eukprot:TRINITY_DN29434_c0_g1_i1.p2 TRINITY_DN29434_c0_g1~~TRINITY_DN29434_c0_g1_i1.p2  ORF type:complete len:120 (+),score=24.08 TRINITY_DN29434_c0_g1_i1:162-521(+)
MLRSLVGSEMCIRDRFHRECVVPWFDSSNKCPVCMQQVASPTQDHPPAPTPARQPETYEQRMARLRREYHQERAAARPPPPQSPNPSPPAPLASSTHRSTVPTRSDPTRSALTLSLIHI